MTTNKLKELGISLPMLGGNIYDQIEQESSKVTSSVPPGRGPSEVVVTKLNFPKMQRVL